jgi:peptide/nickel transport system substrate-binding protein
MGILIVREQPFMSHVRVSTMSSIGGAISRRHIIAIGGALAVTPIFGRARAVSAQEATPAPRAGGILRAGVQGDPTELDPHLTVLAAAGLVIELVYEGLVDVGPDLVPQPALAESWKISPDGLTYTFTLRRGVTFHNGRALTAADVIYSIERIRNPETASPSATYTSGISKITAPDDGTVVVTLSTPDASFLSKLGYWGVAIVPREEVEKTGDLTQTMVGTGPFTFTEYVPNTQVVLGRNESYWDAGKPYLDGVELSIVPEDTSRTTALVSGTVDLIEQVPHKDITSLQANDAVVLAGERTTNLRWMVFNLRREPFNNIDFRKAIATAIDRGPIIDAAVFGHGEPLLGLFPEAFWAGYEGVIPAPDVEAAKALLAKVTLSAGFAPKLLTWAQYGFLSNTSVVIQEQLRQLGIEAEIDAQENATYIDNFFSGNFDIAVMGASGYLDPNEWLEQSLKTDAANNAAGYSNPIFDALLEEGLETTDQAARAEIYQQAQQIIIDDAPWINLYTSYTYEGLSSRVHGFEHMLSGGFASLRNVWLEE